MPGDGYPREMTIAPQGEQDSAYRPALPWRPVWVPGVTCYHPSKGLNMLSAALLVAAAMGGQGDQVTATTMVWYLNVTSGDRAVTITVLR